VLRNFHDNGNRHININIVIDHVENTWWHLYSTLPSATICQVERRVGTASSSWWSVLIVRSPERNTMASLGEEHLAMALHPSNDDERVAQLRPKGSASARVHAHQTAMRRMILRWRWDCHPSPAITSMNKLLGSILRNLPLLG
jgi:hypothetical protein